MNAPLILPAEITIYVISDLRATWLAWLDGRTDADLHANPQADGDLHADGSAVDELDAAGLQGLLALSHSARARGRRLRVRAASDTLVQGCRRLGLAHLLDAADEVAA